MVGELAARHALSMEVIDGVSERTGGVPLFVEEVTRLLLERGVEGGAQAIPPTLQQSLAARLDRLGEAREVAQIGAVLGREFSYALLQRVSAELGELGPASRARPARRARTSSSSRAPARGDLSLQARADPGRRLRQPAQEPPPGASPPRRRGRCATARTRRAEPEVDRASFHRGRPRRSRHRMVGQGGRPGACAARPSRRRSPISARRSPWRTRRGQAPAAAARPSWPADAIARRLRQRAYAARGLARRETKAAFAERASLAGRTRTRLIGWRPTTACGSAASCEANCRRCGSTRPTFLSDVGGDARFARSRRRPSVRLDRIWFAGEFRRGAGSSRARARCSNPAATTIWPFRFGQRTWRRARWSTSRSRLAAWRGRRARDFV